MRLWVLAVAIAACSSDPTLHVEVKNPDGLAIAKTIVTVYESSTLDCEAIEYGDASDVELQAAQVASETLTANAAPAGNLDNLSRTDPKLVVARAYRSDGVLLAAGCSEKDEVVGDDSVTVTTEPAAVASVRLADTSLTTDRYGVAVDTFDVNGVAIDGRQVWWRVWGPSGTKPYQQGSLTTPAIDGVQQDSVWQPPSPSCSQDGTATIHPMPPDMVSGYAIQTRVAWATAQPPLITGITTIDLAATPLTTPPGSSKFCALGRDATGPAIVCLESGGANVNAYRITSGGNLSQEPEMTFATPKPFAVFSLPDGSGTDVYAVMPSGAPVRVFGPGTAQALPCTGCNLLSFDDVLVAPSCAMGQSPLVLLHDPTGVGSGTNKQHVLAVDAVTGAVSAIALPVDLALNSAGCASELDANGQPTTTQVIALDAAALGVSSGASGSVALSGCTSGGPNLLTCKSTSLPTAGAPLGFTTGMVPEMIVPDIDATGVVLSTAVLGSDGRLLELSRQPAAGVPHLIVSGKFDNDGATDLAFDIQGQHGVNLFDLTYARLVDGQPLAAIAPLRSAATKVGLVMSDLFTADLDGNGTDDLVFVGHPTADPLAFGLSVVLLGVPETPASQIPSDMTCAE